MKAAELYDLVVAADREKLCQVLAPLDDAQREELNDFAWRLYNQISGAWSASVFNKRKDLERYGDDVHALMDALRGRKYEDWRVPRWAAALAVLALCDLRRIRNPWSDDGGGWLHSDLRDMPQRVLQILDARRPAWLAKWIEADVKREPRVTTWFVERSLIRSGALPANETEGYVQRMAEENAIFDRGDEFKTDNLKQQFDSWKDVLLADPDLLEHDVWRLFEVENNAFRYRFDPWASALKELSDEERLDRARLLEASIRAASLPMKESVLSAYGKFHEYLEPTIDEREKLIDEYMLLLESRVPIVVGFALKALEVVAKAKRLPAEAFFAACEPVFRLDKKTHPAKAIALTRLLIKQDAGCKAAAALAMARALASDIPDVQEAAMDTLESLNDHLGREAADAINDAIERVAAALKPRLRTLLDSTGEAGHETSPAEVSKKAEQVGGPTGSELDARVSAIPAAIGRQTATEQAVRWVRDGSEPQVFPIDPRHVPRRVPSMRVAPLDSIDELIDSVGALCEGVDDAMEIERILDGIARFHHQPPSDFDKRVDALRKRVGKESKPWAFTFLDQLTNVGLTQVIRRWLRMPPVLRELFKWREANESLYRDRLRELCWYLDKDDEGPRGLLAMPTHRGGWIDPVVLAERLQRDYVEPKEVPDQYDLAQAILRLTIDGRDEAIKMLGKPDHYNGDRHLFYALGAPIEFEWGEGFGEDALQSASVRARAQLEDPAAFHPPRALAAACFDAQGRIALNGPVASDPALPPQLLEVIYGLEVANGSEQIGGPRAWQVEWENLCYPFDHRASLLMAATCLSSSRSRLTPLFDRDTVWQAEAARAAIVAASADSADARSLATDALVEAIGAMLVEPATLGRQLAAVGSLIKLNRVAAVLKATAATSRLHHWAVFGAIDAFLAACKLIPTDLHHLLSVMLESGAVLGKSTSEEAAATLKSINVAGKTAKLAKQLIQLSGDRAGMAEVRDQACQAVLARAERWRNLIADVA
ncbi:MAG TPA: DUF6493 family protein [Pirellulales bacterium]|nr:DUF6493 family protein [Pirellulales bacterium]